jgi:DNA mismatch repair protein MutS2
LKELTLRQREQLIKQEGAGEFRRFLTESRKGLENLVKEIREGEMTREKTLRVKDFIRGLEDQSAALDAALEADAAANAPLTAQDGGAAAPQIAPGDEVLAGPSRCRGKVIRAAGAKKTGRYWIVETGSVRMSFPEQELLPVPGAVGGGANAQAGGAAADSARVGWAAELAPSETFGGAKLEIKLLGMRLDEALETLRHQIDAAVIAGLREFSVVHGKGDGILQQGVHDYLRNDPAVAEFFFSRPELGGTGRTEVVLR